jgi:hypothetical protein
MLVNAELQMQKKNLIQLLPLIGREHGKTPGWLFSFQPCLHYDW